MCIAGKVIRVEMIELPGFREAVVPVVARPAQNETETEPVRHKKGDKKAKKKAKLEEGGILLGSTAGDQQDENQDEKTVEKKSGRKRKGPALKDISDEPAMKPKGSYLLTSGDQPAISSFDLFRDYFEAFSIRAKRATSNNAFSKLRRLEPDRFTELLQSTRPKHVEERHALLDFYRDQFPQWYFELMNGYCLGFYGLGSKKSLLRQFACSYLRDAPLLDLNGNFPDVSTRMILDRIITEVLPREDAVGLVRTTDQDMLEGVREYFARPDRALSHFYLLVHNIYGVGVSMERIQALIFALAQIKHIRFIVSVDHVFAGLLPLLQINRLLWHDLTTFKPYLDEVRFVIPRSLLDWGDGESSSRGVRFVLRSLPANTRKIFRILAEHQIALAQTPELLSSMAEEEDSNKRQRKSQQGKVRLEELGLTFESFYARCRDEFLVNSDLTFRTQLTEFRDHNIIKTKKTSDGLELLYIPIDPDALQAIVSEIN